MCRGNVNNKPPPLKPSTHPTPAQQSTNCGTFFESIHNFEDELAGSSPKSIAIWAYNKDANGNFHGDDGFLPLMGFGSSQNSGADCTCVSLSVNYHPSHGTGSVGCHCDDWPSYPHMQREDWFHNVITYSGGANGKIRLYTNGKEVRSATRTLNIRGDYR